MKRLCFAALLSTLLMILITTAGRAAAPACDTDNGGLKLPQRFCAQNAEWPAEYLGRATDGANFGWPYCFYNNAEGRLVTNPEYGGDGKKTDRCGGFTPPAVAFPGHWAAARPGGLAVGPDGSLYIAEDTKGRIWRVMYKAK
jgi:glucose/arabinose dehydrogenase